MTRNAAASQKTDFWLWPRATRDLPLAPNYAKERPVEDLWSAFTVLFELESTTLTHWTRPHLK